jgi:hypothetical protein
MRPSARFARAVLASCAAAALLLGRPAAAQTPANPFTAKNAFYFEGGGNALLYSVNYERIVFANLVARVGVSAIPGWFPWVGEDGGGYLVMVPVQVGMLFGPGNHHFELGAGATFGNAAVDIGDFEESESWVFATGTVGYRYQPPEGGVIFRATLTPLFIEALDVGVIPMIGLSVGHSF